MTTQTQLPTLADYVALDEPEDEYVTELVRGVVVREPRPGRLHGLIQVEMAYHLRAWAKGRGAEVTAESGYVLSEEPATVRGPDVAVVVEPRSSEGQPGGWVRDAPDVAVEVLSPSDTSSAMQQKTLEYLETGARLVWIVDPEARTVTVHRPDGSANILREHQTLTGEDVLDGFSVEVREIFEH
jgi:Uma2 family endonuclease